jgi:dTDP-4-amino-4,6-dideoxygalactose transaminase
MTEWRIPFNRVEALGREVQYVQEAIANGHLAGNGPFTARCERLLEDEVGGRVLLTTTGSHALELAALLVELQPGDEVIVPSFAYVTSASAFALRGARPVFADVRPDTLNIDESLVEPLLTPRTRALLALHYAGVACDLDALAALGVPVIEDNALGLFGRYRGRPLGSFGRFGALSFHETKNVTSGEGGALVLNDAGDVERAEILRDKGTNRSSFLRGEVDAYTWVDLGSSFAPSELSAAFLAGQLERAAEAQSARSSIWERYHEALADWAEQTGTARPYVPVEAEQPYHLYYLKLPDRRARDGLIEHLRARGILAVFHYQPLHLSAVGRRLGGRPGQCPVAEDVAGRLVRLPFFTTLGESDQDEVIDAVLAFEA